MKKVVFDTNTLISGLLWDGNEARVIEKAENKEISLFIPREMIEELENVLKREKFCKKLKGKDFAISTNSDIYLYDTQKGNTANMTEGMMGYDRYPAFSPDNTKIAFQSMETPGYESNKARLFIYNIAEKTKKDLTTGFDQDAAHFQWAGDSKIIFFISGYHATYQVYSMQTETGEIKPITKGVHDYTGIAYHNSILVGTKMSMVPNSPCPDCGR